MRPFGSIPNLESHMVCLILFGNAVKRCRRSAREVCFVPQQRFELLRAGNYRISDFIRPSIRRDAGEVRRSTALAKGLLALSQSACCKHILPRCLTGFAGEAYSTQLEQHCVKGHLRYRHNGANKSTYGPKLCRARYSRHSSHSHFNKD